MTKAKKLIVLMICSGFLFITILGFSSVKQNYVYAETFEETVEQPNELDGSEDDGITPYWLTTLAMTINGGNGEVWATVSNDFTLFFPTVNVIVQLFYSYEYCEDYNQMTLAAINAIEDLDIGKTITAKASTEGEERFWMARMRYRENAGSWNERVTSARFSADGTYMGII